MFRYLPEQASEFAPTIDRIHNLITDISVFFTVAIVGTMIYFAIRYRRRNGVDHETPHIEGSVFLEVLWTVVPSIICVFVAAYGLVGYKQLREVPEGAIEIDVVGAQWNWTFQYPNGKKTVDEFVVPVNTPVKLILSSRDVIHSFFVPGMRTKMDAVPGLYTYQWFKPVKTGVQQVYCTEYCGTSHARMLAKMHVVSQAEYERWLEEKEREKSPAEAGREIYKTNQCISCHSLDGTRLVGPTFLNLFGSKKKWTDGKEYQADENYLRESILNPNAHIVEGFGPNIMPAFEGRLNEDQLSQLIAFIKSVKGEKKAAPAAVKDLSKLSPAERGKLLYSDKACIGCHSLDGSKVVGPTFKGLFGKSDKFDDGSSYTADEAYLKESILDPQAHIVGGFPKPSPMPSYQGQLSDQEIGDIIEYIKTVK